MNFVMEALFPEEDCINRRQALRFLPLSPRLDDFTNYLHEEMRQCYLNGHDHAAIVTACALIDFSVKDAIHFKEFVAAGCEFDSARWDEIDRLKFGKAINLAKSNGTVLKPEWEKLDWIRENVRNVYMHGETPRWLKDAQIEGVRTADLSTGDVTSEPIPLRENLTFQRRFRLKADRDTCDNVVPLVDTLVRTLAIRAAKMLESWKSKNATRPTADQVRRILKNMAAEGFEPDEIIASDVPDGLDNDADPSQRDS